MPAILVLLVTSRLTGGPKDGLSVTNVPPVPRDLVFDESLMAINYPDPWAAHRLRTVEFQGWRHLRVTEHALSFSRLHFYRKDPRDELCYVYIGWYSLPR